MAVAVTVTVTVAVAVAHAEDEVGPDDELEGATPPRIYQTAVSIEDVKCQGHSTGDSDSLWLVLPVVHW